MWMCLNPKFYSNVQQGATPLLAEPYFCHLIATVETDRKAKRERVEDMQQRVPRSDSLYSGHVVYMCISDHVCLGMATSREVEQVIY